MSANEIFQLYKWWWDLRTKNALHFAKSRFLYIAAYKLTKRRDKYLIM